MTLVLIVSLHGYFDDPHREVLVFAGFLLLIWLPAIRCPAACTVVAGMVAEASLYIYLTHYQVYPLFDAHPLLGVIASVVVGILITRLVNAAAQLDSRARRHASLLRRRFPLCDEPLLREGGRDDAVGADQAAGHHAATPRGGG